MKRLTYFDGGKWRLKIGNTEYSGEAINRLAAYEDTGLEPEEIGALKSREKGLVELLNGVSCGCAVTYTRLRELAQADKEGRCVVLDDITVADLQQMLSVLDSTHYGDDTETYTTGYRNGHRNGRIEILRHVLGIHEGTSEYTEAALRREQDEKGGGSE